jgi:hypothetical protein
MNFKVGSYVEWKDIKGYIRFISDEYISICVNIHDDTIFDCCVCCYHSYWNEVIIHKDVTPIYPIMYASVAQLDRATVL